MGADWAGAEHPADRVASGNVAAKARTVGSTSNSVAAIVLSFFGNGEESMQADLPQDGDVLVSHPTATVEHDICIVPRSPHITCPSHDSAVAEGRELAEQLRVDAWLTEDHSHFLRIAAFRR